MLLGSDSDQEAPLYMPLYASEDCAIIISFTVYAMIQEHTIALQTWFLFPVQPKC